MIDHFIRHHFIEAGNFKLDGGAMFGIIPKSLWNKKVPCDQDNRIDLALRLWLIETSDRLILIDTGIGDYHNDSFNQRFDLRGRASPLTCSLMKFGKKPSDLTDLILSHLHFDHVGGICEKDDTGEIQPVFKNARCHIHQKHYEYAHAPTARDQGSFHTHYFDPILNYYRERDRLIFHNGDENTLLTLGPHDSLKFKVSHGHTPFLMHPYNNQYIYLADLIPTSHHVPIPWVMGYDINPGISTQDKLQFLKFIYQNNLKIIFEHDPKYWGTRIGLNQKKQFINKQLYALTD